MWRLVVADLGGGPALVAPAARFPLWAAALAFFPTLKTGPDLRAATYLVSSHGAQGGEDVCC